QDDLVEQSHVSLIRDNGHTVNLLDNCDSLLDKNTCIVSYNLHGLNQGRSCVRDLIDMNTVSPSIFLFQEHWLTPANLCLLTKYFPEYIAIGKSAMELLMEQGPLRGRPFGGVAILVKQCLINNVLILHCDERYVVIKYADYIIVNVYLPCEGTTDRCLIIENILVEISLLLDANSLDHIVIIGGDFNTDLNETSQASTLVKNLMVRYHLYRCDAVFDRVNLEDRFTYINEALDRFSCIDYFLVSDVSKLSHYSVLELEINLSDHRPVCVKFNIATPKICRSTENVNKINTVQLRWDHANLPLYYDLTGIHCQNLLHELNLSIGDARDCSKVSIINEMYDKLVATLQYCASLSVPKHEKDFYKYWWDQELDLLKDESIKSHNLWKLAGKPRNGPCFNKYRADKLAYKLRIRHCQENETLNYTNDLHNALMNKQGPDFWKCWRSKFGSKEQEVIQVDGLTNASDIAEIFVRHFQSICTPHTVNNSKNLQDIYNDKRPAYNGTPSFRGDSVFDAEIVSNVVVAMKRGKAAGLDGLTAEHFQHCHPCVPTILAKLFNLMLEVGKVPVNFGFSYTIPLLKVNNARLSKSLTVNDFRGISISPVVSKIFENAILFVYKDYFITSDNQFGFKKNSSCSHAIYCVRQAVNNFIDSGSTVNLCALDLSKAFDKMNHCGLYIKLMDRNVPNCLLEILEHWFSICSTCVRWGPFVSRFVNLSCGVRQGGVLSPHLFSIYVDDVIDKITRSNTGCNVRLTCISIFMYADDILILSPSVTYLQRLIRLVESELSFLDMPINASKSMCIRVGPRHNVVCADITASNGTIIPWVNAFRYLGIYIMSGRVFKCDFAYSKLSLFRSFNALF
ncbi:MAG: hypothetical protein RIS29_3259, partial [Bacteroidota bacterium]